MTGRVRLTELVGRKVITNDAVELGDLIDLDLDPAGWQVHWLYVRLHRALTDRFHVDAPFVMGTKAISFPVTHVSSIGRQITLLATLAEIIPVSVIDYDTDATNHLGRRA